MHLLFCNSGILKNLVSVHSASLFHYWVTRTLIWTIFHPLSYLFSGSFCSGNSCFQFCTISLNYLVDGFYSFLSRILVIQMLYLQNCFSNFLISSFLFYISLSFCSVFGEISSNSHSNLSVEIFLFLLSCFYEFLLFSEQSICVLIASCLYFTKAIFFLISEYYQVLF